MLNRNNFSPVKSPVRQRLTPLVLQTQKVYEERNAIAVDPLLKLSEAVSLLGNPSYTTLRSWIKSGSLHCFRVGRGHHRVRLSEIKQFLLAIEVNNG
jgi:pSer/pThr/pTyr-binding forkhead associated (FHA) protein